MNRKRVLVAMSGGVDSSVAAALLVEQGFEVVGATMKTFCYGDTPLNSRTCCGLDGILDARSVAESLGIAHYVFDMEEAFTRDVIDDFVSEYTAGRTPNPCVRCNSNTKIPDLLGTGPTPRLRSDRDRPLRSLGPRREWTPRHPARRRPRQGPELFPLGSARGGDGRAALPGRCVDEADVRARARALGLSPRTRRNRRRSASCRSAATRTSLRARIGSGHPALKPGAIVDRSGRVVGEHAGYARYTVGQRKGLGGGRGRPFSCLASFQSGVRSWSGTRASCTATRSHWAT
jgi:tRNA-uridine 2-sulfurtransferase